MLSGPTVNLVSGRLVACFYNTCEIYQEGSWNHLQNTTAMRRYHSSASTKDAVLLIGGGVSPDSIEWIPVDGSPAHQALLKVRHGPYHCTIQISDDVLVLTGGLKTYDYVTRYDLAGGKENLLTPMVQPREQHACGVYKDTDNRQVREKALQVLHI